MARETKIGDVLSYEGDATVNAAGVPPGSLRLLAQCCGFGANKYGAGNWTLSPVDNHTRAIEHLSTTAK